MIKSIERTKETKNIRVAKLPVVELVIRLSTFCEYDEDIRRIITEATDDGYQNDDGLLITYAATENMFIVVTSNHEYDYMSEMYVPDYKPSVFDKIQSISPKQYRFSGGGSFTKTELEIISNCKNNNSTPEAKLINKMIKEMMIRNIYNYSI